MSSLRSFARRLYLPCQLSQYSAPKVSTKTKAVTGIQPQGVMKVSIVHSTDFPMPYQMAFMFAARLEKRCEYRRAYARATRSATC